VVGVIRRKSHRTFIAAVAAALMVVSVSTAAALASEDAEEHEVLGRFSLESEAGGAVWAFQPGGLLVITGPGDISSEGAWSPASGARAFDARVDYDIAGQDLSVVGQVSPDADRIAVYVLATDAIKPEDADPWPSESRLVGERFGMISEATPEPTAMPVDCTRPQWIGADIDWDGCDEGLTPA
jgi:hypothetical protein